MVEIYGRNLRFGYRYVTKVNREAEVDIQTETKYSGIALSPGLNYGPVLQRWIG